MLRQTSPKERLLARIDGALDNQTITTAQAAEFRRRVETASNTRLQEALQVQIGDDFLRPGGQTALGQLAGKIIQDVITGAGQQLYGLGRGAKARSTVNERELRTQVQRELSQAPGPGVTAEEGVTYRSAGFLMPKAVEALWSALSAQPGVEAQAYASRFGGQSYYTFQSKGDDGPTWRLQVYTEHGERVAAGTATPQADGLGFQWVDRAGDAIAHPRFADSVLGFRCDCGHESLAPGFSDGDHQWLLL